MTPQNEGEIISYTPSPHQRLFRKFLALIILSLSFGMTSCVLFTPSYSIAVVSRTPESTPSLNPLRIRTATQIAWEDHYDSQKYPFQLSLDTLYYSGGKDEMIKVVEAHMKTRKTIAVIGDITSASSRDLAAFAMEKGLVHISTMAVEEAFVVEHAHTFSTRNRLIQESETIIDIIQNHYPDQGMHIVYTDLSGLKPRADTLFNKGEEAGIAYIQVFEQPTGTHIFKVILEHIQSCAEPCVVILILPSSLTEHFIQQYSILDLPHPVILSSVSMNQDLIPFWGTMDFDFYGVVPRISYMTGHSSDLQRISADPRLLSFSRRYTDRTGFSNLDSIGADTYVGARVLLEVIRREGHEVQAILEGLRAYDDIEITGPIAFSPEGLLTTNHLLPVRITPHGLIVFDPSP